VRVIGHADDPEIDLLQRDNQSERKPKAPAVYWILATFLLIAYIQKRSDHIFSEFGDLNMRKGKNRTQPYSKKLMIFCMTMAGYSARAYEFLRKTAQNCLPCMSTIRNYRKRIDGSPGFSAAALNMITNKVKEMTDQSKKLFVSISCDDMSIRENLWFTGKTFSGHEDIGDGPGPKPAKHVMMIMATALNMSWKVPIGYFLIPDAFPADKRADLLRTAVYHLNIVGVVITSIVMDNCPVNYATFKHLGCILSRKYTELNPATDMYNILGKNILSLFDPPHLIKLGNCFLREIN